MKALSNMGFAFFGAALVVISYGLARFAFGLFVPAIIAELALTPYVIGIIGALPEAEDTGLQAAYDQQLVDEEGNPIEPVNEEEETL